MGSSFKRRERRLAKGRVKGLQDGRSFAFHSAGLRLLADADYDAISIAKIAKEAGCSVGAFYYRYPDKVSYLRQLITATFGRLEKEYELKVLNADATSFRNGIRLSEFIALIVDQLSRPETAGIIRASLKLGSADPDALRRYGDYRNRIAADAVSLFSQKSSKRMARERIREAMQIVFATVADSIQMPSDAAMKASGKKLKASMCDLVAGYWGVQPDFVVRDAIHVQPPERIVQPTQRLWEKDRLERESRAEISQGKPVRVTGRARARRRLL